MGLQKQIDANFKERVARKLAEQTEKEAAEEEVRASMAQDRSLLSPYSAPPYFPHLQCLLQRRSQVRLKRKLPVFA